MRLRAAWIGSGVLLALLSGYVASPYIALWRLGIALRGGNAAFVADHVDWDAVRQGMVQQVDMEIRGEPVPTQPVATDGLPPFGSSFATGLAHNVVDDAFHPAAVQAALRRLAIAGGGPGVNLRWAFFDGVGSFLITVEVQRDSQVRDMQVHLSLSRATWRVVRVDAAPELLASFSAHT
jgi:hypothetical protein